MPARFRRHRNPDGRRPVFRGDFPDGRDVTEAIQAAGPAPWDGTTVPLSAVRGQPRYMPPGVAPYPGTPQMPRPPIMLAGQQAPWVMTVSPPRPGDPGPTPEALEVTRFLRDKVRILRRRGQLDRISDEKLAMLPAMSRRTTARVIVDEAAELLRYGGDPR